MATDVFISYAREDVECAEFVERILTEQQWSVWRDVKRLLPGYYFSKQLLAAAGKAPCLIVLWSDAALQSSWVKREASIGLREETLIPISVDGTEPPSTHRSIQWLNLTGWEDIVGIDTETESDEDLDKMVASVREKLGESSLEDLLYWYLFGNRNVWCWPTNIRNDAELWMRFQPISDYRVSEIEDALSSLAERGYIFESEGGAFAFI